MKHAPIVGKFEIVSFPEFGIKDVVAKIDTGAFSGALHCTKIKEVNTPKGKELRFSPFDHPSVVMKTRKYVVGGVRSSNGQAADRFFITTKIVVKGIKYPITISLSDRSSMRYPVLLGTRFLSENNFLVDVSLDNR